MTQRKVCGGHKLAQSYISIQNVFDKDKSWLMGLIEVRYQCYVIVYGLS